MTQDTALELYKVQMERFHKTRDIVWKMDLSIWALIAGAIHEAKSISEKICPCGAIFLCLAMGFAHAFFTWRTQKSLEVSKKICANIILDLNRSTNNDDNIDISIDKADNEAKLKIGAWGWICVQLVVTAILLIVLYVFLKK